ncbi:MAG: DNA repair protein RadA [Bacteroidales bacterium]|nr:DNA repair protein RadA [Bacteroidales bacterium]MCF8328242.1 DNA repair protein RadA [Bacteroidales bacterium]
MAKVKKAYFCQNCGAQSPKWIGKCPSCGEWNTYVEEIIQKEKSGSTKTQEKSHRVYPQKIDEITYSTESRISSSSKELNRVLGGGIVPGSIVLVGGEPGIGKSTLMLQVALRLSGQKVLYVSGEESEQQIKMRAERIGARNKDTYILTSTQTDEIFSFMDEVDPAILIIDSIQSITTSQLESSAGSISQIRESASELHKFAKNSGIPVFLIGHITKEGHLAGPKVLEHMVDTVLQFEGDRNYGYRIIRSVKNRFGSTSELGIYEMLGTGLREVDNPSEILLSQRDEDMSGIAIAATIEGLRPMLIEIQALVSNAAYGTPQRSSTGFDLRRLNMLLAVLEKRSGFRLSTKDVFLNIAGGIRVDDPALDLAVIASVLSSNEDTAIDQKSCFAGEVGLSGEIRAVTRIDQRISEAEKLGFERMFISSFNKKGLNLSDFKIEIVPVSRVENLFRHLFG